MTTISYSLARHTMIHLTIYSIKGDEIIVLAKKYQLAGEYRVTWDGKDASGNPVASGIYLYRLEAGGFVKTRRMLFLR